jgi:adenylate kinase
MTRERPNFLVTGTPGVGKSTFSTMLASRFGLTHIAVGQLIADKHLWEERDDERDCTIYSDQLLDEEIESILSAHPGGGLVFDFHASDIVPAESLDFVVVLQCESDVLWQRLAERGYAEPKIRENTEAEIFQTILNEVNEDFPEEMVLVIQSNAPEDLAGGVATIEAILNPAE